MASKIYFEGLSQKCTMCSSIDFALSLQLLDDGRFPLVFFIELKISRDRCCHFCSKTIEVCVSFRKAQVQTTLLGYFHMNALVLFYRRSWKIINEDMQRVAQRLTNPKGSVQRFVGLRKSLFSTADRTALKEVARHFCLHFSIFLCIV